MADHTDWRSNLIVTHPAWPEAQVMREARVLRNLAAFLEANGDELQDKELRKLEKVINIRMLDIMDKIRDAAP